MADPISNAPNLHEIGVDLLTDQLKKAICKEPQ